MLTIHFTAEDLLRVHLAAAPAPLLELTLAIAVLRQRARSDLFSGWRADKRAQLPSRAGPLVELIPANGKGPTFVDPISDGVDEGLDLVAATPPALVASEMQRVCAAGLPATTWVRQLAHGDRASRPILLDAVQAAQQVLLGEDWSRVRATHAADLAVRGAAAACDGWQVTLTRLFPGATWSGSTLRIPRPTDHEVHLGGRGLTLTSSAFWTGPALISTHPDGSGLVVYPAVTPLPLVQTHNATTALTDLLGRTRAAALAALTVELTTGDLARSLDISPANASEHAKTLRAAGLIGSRRDGKAVRHTCTPLGWQLLGLRK